MEDRSSERRVLHAEGRVELVSTSSVRTSTSKVIKVRVRRFLKRISTV